VSTSVTDDADAFHELRLARFGLLDTFTLTQDEHGLGLLILAREGHGGSTARMEFSGVADLRIDWPLDPCTLDVITITDATDHRLRDWVANSSRIAIPSLNPN